MRKKVLLKVSACCLVVIMSFSVLIQGTLATKEKSTIPISHDDTETVSHSKNTPNPETDLILVLLQELSQNIRVLLEQL